MIGRRVDTGGPVDFTREPLEGMAPGDIGLVLHQLLEAKPQTLQAVLVATIRQGPVDANLADRAALAVLTRALVGFTLLHARDVVGGLLKLQRERAEQAGGA